MIRHVHHHPLRAIKCVTTVMDSNEGFQTKVWGPPIWLFLHIVTLNYQPERKDAHIAFFKALASVLPCGACRKNYSRIISSGSLALTDPVFKSRKSLAYWLFRVHNRVQSDIFAKTKKECDRPKFTDSKEDFDRAMALYLPLRAQCIKDSYGCTVPLKGSRKRTKIKIHRFTRCSKWSSIDF